ncbi:MAG: DNA recombination protein RmuC [Bacteroidales bacterium]|nr:DNA recombination protein RmuC [Bacteroidales bacterium]MBR4452862.1 DNA recombination protein RmuC [Bacteroidales bacterium]
MDTLTIIVIIGIAIIIVLQIVFYFQSQHSKHEDKQSIGNLKNEMDNTLSNLRQEINNNMRSDMSLFGETINRSQEQAINSQKDSFNALNKSLNEQIDTLQKNLFNLQSSNATQMDKMRATVDEKMKEIRESNEKKLNDIQKTVDEKLQTTLETRMKESFALVSDRLEQVYKGLGEMTNLATNVGDLKQMLSSVKQRGNFGEIALDNILSDILTPDQYEKQFEVAPDTKKVVDFAVKMPGSNETALYLPIDSKFSGDTFVHLQQAYDTGNKEDIEKAGKALEKSILDQAKSIHDKYIYPPYTTNFAIMFLPSESLYAEVVRREVFSKIQQEFHVTVAGPSTMAAMLYSLQMGFQTLQIQKKSNEVWNILSAVKTEFDKFANAFNTVQKNLRTIETNLDNLVGTRTRAIQKKLKDIKSMDQLTSAQILQLDEPDTFDEDFTEEDHQ